MGHLLTCGAFLLAFHQVYEFVRPNCDLWVGDRVVIIQTVNTFSEVDKLPCCLCKKENDLSNI